MKLKSKLYPLLLILSLPLLLFTCAKDKDQAINSLNGNWEVVGINSVYGEFFENGFNPSETVEEIGQLGTFNFSPDSVKFEYTRNDTLYTGSETWIISSEKVNTGFTKVTEFTLKIPNHFVFGVDFGNGTKDSEKNANEASFVAYPDSIGYGVFIELKLEKI